MTPHAARIGAAGAALAALAICLLVADPMARVLAVSLAALTLFATRAVPEIVSALATFVAFLAIGAAPPGTIFSGFAAGGFWLLIGGLVIGAAITSTGLGDQVARRIFARTGQSYVRAVWLLSLAGVALGVLVPSAIPRVIVIVPVALSLARTMGFEPGSRGHAGLTITAATMTLIPTYGILTANLPTIVEMGAIEVLHGVHTGYGRFFVLQAPINLLRFAVLLAVVLALGRGVAEAGPSEAAVAAPLTRAQSRLLWVLAAAIGLWATDAVHGIPPAWVSLAAGMILLLPRLGVLPEGAMRSEIDLSIAFFIAAVLCLSAVVDEVGLGARIGAMAIPAMGLSEGHDLRNLLGTTAFGSAVSHLTTAPGAPVVLAPLAGATAEATGWSIETVAMMHNMAFSTTFLPFQSPPLMIAIALGGIPVLALTRVCLWTGLASLGLGVPLTWAWWSLLGAI